MKKLLCYSLASIFAIAIDYLSFAFLMDEINFRNWGMDTRFAFLFVGFIFIVVSCAIAMFYFDNMKKIEP